MGLNESVKEVQNLEAQVPFGKVRDYVLRSPYANHKWFVYHVYKRVIAGVPLGKLSLLLALCIWLLHKDEVSLFRDRAFEEDQMCMFWATDVGEKDGHC
jgi:hypothetical protein